MGVDLPSLSVLAHFNAATLLHFGKRTCMADLGLVIKRQLHMRVNRRYDCLCSLHSEQCSSATAGMDWVLVNMMQVAAWVCNSISQMATTHELSLSAMQAAWSSWHPHTLPTALRLVLCRIITVSNFNFAFVSLNHSVVYSSTRLFIHSFSLFLFVCLFVCSFVRSFSHTSLFP